MYNEERPCDSLGDLTPAEYLLADKQAESSKNAWTYYGDTYKCTFLC